MTRLSPEAQAVLDATDYPEDWATRTRVAGALRALAEQNEYADVSTSKTVSVVQVDHIIDIANELEAL